MTAAAVPDDGVRRFARYAAPPNALGYCGPDAHEEIVSLAGGGPTDTPPGRLAAGFEGAWPYLELLAGASGHRPLDDPVVQAYWIGGPLLGLTPLFDWGRHLEDRFEGRAGGEWERLLAGATAGGLPTHGFHVLCVYPWVGLLRAGIVDEPLHVIDQCRIRWARVEGEVDGRLLVRAETLEWVDGALVLGPPRVEQADCLLELGPEPARVGRWVALHWGWVCDELDDAQVGVLSRLTEHHLRVANRTGAAARAAVG